MEPRRLLPEGKEPYDASDIAQVKKKTAEADVRRDRRARVVQAIQSTPDGRDWMWGVLERCNIFATTFRADSHETAFNEGRRSVGLEILAEVMRSAPESYVTMQKEANDNNG